MKVKSSSQQIVNFGFRAAASVFNVLTVWMIFYFWGNDWGQTLYLQLSSILIISTLTRLGVDQSLLFSAKEIHIPGPFFLASVVFSVLLYGLTVKMGLTPSIELLSLVVIIFLAHAISYLEAVIRTLPDSASSHASVIGIQSFCVLLACNLRVSLSYTLMTALALQAIFYFLLIYKKNGTIKFDNKVISQISLSGLAHGSHGLINQNYVTYFVTRFGTAQDLPNIITIVRILYLSSWPLSQFTFSDVYQKSVEGKGFRQTGLFYGACFLSAACFAVMLVYTHFSSTPNLTLIGIILAAGIISFSTSADKMYRPTGHRSYKTIIAIQSAIIVASIGLGKADLVNNLVICTIFSTYLMTCSIFSRYHQ